MLSKFNRARHNVFNSFACRSFASQTDYTWLKTKLSTTPTEKTVGILVDSEEITNEGLGEALGLSKYFKSKEFRQDLTMDKYCWIYPENEGRRILLLQHKEEKKAEEKPEESEVKAVKQISSLGSLACN